MTACTAPQEPAPPDAGVAPAEPDDSSIPLAALAPHCKKGIHVTLRTNYGIEAFDPTRVAQNEYPNGCWIDNDKTAPGLQLENLDSREWRRCNKLTCEPIIGKTDWYYDDTSMFSTAQDRVQIARVHEGMGAIRGTVDMANRGAGWNDIQMNAGGATDIVDRWFAETHAATGDHAGCQFQENDYVDDWVTFIHARNNFAIRPQLVVISADHVCADGGRPIEDCPAAYAQVKHACELVGSGRTLGITAEGGIKLQYGHCLGDVIKAINECTCDVNGGCF